MGVQPAVGGSFSSKIERELGRQVKAVLAASSGLVEDPLLLAWVRGIGGNIAAVAPRQPFVYDFSIADWDEMNAFALPGGFIFVTRGLLEAVQSDDELAGVLAHEIAHVCGRDGMRQIEKQVLMVGLLSAFKNERWNRFVTVMQCLHLLGSLKYSRQLESRADRRGAEYSHRAGYDPAGLGDFLRQLLSREKRSWSDLETLLSTHPPTPERLAALQTSEWLDPHCPDRLLEQGDRLREAYRLEPARAKYVLALAQRPDSAEIQGRLAEVYALAGWDREARAAAARTLAQDPENPWARQALARLERVPAPAEPSPAEPLEARLARWSWRRWGRQNQPQRQALWAGQQALAARLRDTQRCHQHNDWLNDATLARPQMRDLRWWMAIGEARALMLEIESLLSAAHKAARGIASALATLDRWIDSPPEQGWTDGRTSRMQAEMDRGLAELRLGLHQAEQARLGADRAARLLTPILVDLTDPYSASSDHLSSSRWGIWEAALYAAHRYVSRSRGAAQAALSLAAKVQCRQGLLQLSWQEEAAAPARRELFAPIAARRLGVPVDSIPYLQHQGYAYGEAVVLLALHRITGQAVLDLKRQGEPDGNWMDLAERRGVDLDALRITLQMLARHLEETQLTP